MSKSIEDAVKERYSNAAKEYEKGLCCPVDYDPQYLKVIPQEVLERDYGCGDPLSAVKEGEIVLDLGSGGGKVAFIVSQIVGPDGKVIGVDINDEMLKLSRNAAPIVADKIGYSNVVFRKGKIQDLQLDYEKLDSLLKTNPVKTSKDLENLTKKIKKLKQIEPLIEDNSIDIVISNCVLNLVSTEDKEKLFKEIYRVLKPGGRAVISDIVSNNDVPIEMQQDTELWSGCYSGAMREDRFLNAFAHTNFYGITLYKREETWTTIHNISFRSITITAYKGKEGPCLDRKQSVIYRGPFKEVLDDDGHVFERGKKSRVCDKTYKIMKREPYKKFFDFVDPIEPVAIEDALPMQKGHAQELQSPESDKLKSKNDAYISTSETVTSDCNANCDC